MMFSEEVQNELRAKGLAAFVSNITTPNQSANQKSKSGVNDHQDNRKQQPLTSPPEIELVVYENEKWHPILQEFGSVVNVHLNAVLDRAPLTDESGSKVISGALSDIKPLSKYKWKEEWSVWVEPGVTDSEGYQYASLWHFFNRPLVPNAGTRTPVFGMRRRRWRRVMEYHTAAAAQRTTPFNLAITFQRARLLGNGANSNSHVEVRLNGDALLYRTSSGPPDWNAAFNFGLMEIDSDDQLHFAVYSKKAGLVTSSSEALQLRGTEKLALNYFRQFKDKGVRQHELILTMPGSGGTKGGYLLLSFELTETNFFSVVPQYSPAFELLERVIGNSLSPELKQSVAALDNDKGDLLRILVDNIITGKDILVESDILDIVNEVEFVQGTSPSFIKHDGGIRGDGRIYRQRTATQVYNRLIHKEGRFRHRRYPHGKLCFSKLMLLLPPVPALQWADVADFNRMLNHIRYREEDLELLNTRYESSFPTCSSVYDLTYDALSCYELTRYNSSGDCGQFYDLSIVCSTQKHFADIGCTEMKSDALKAAKLPFVGHVLRFDSFYDYLMTLKELSRMQHMQVRTATPVHYSITALHGITTIINVDPRPSNNYSSSYSNIATGGGDNRTGERLFATAATAASANTRIRGDEVSLPKSWQPVTFTIDGEQDLLIIREAVQSFDAVNTRFDEGTEDQVLNVLLPFSQVEGIIAHNSYHMYPRYNLEIHLQSITSFHLTHTYEHCCVDIDTTDGKNHCQSSYGPQKRVVFPNGDQQPTSIVLQDTFNLLLPQKAVQCPSIGHHSSPTSTSTAAAAEEFVHFTVRTPAIKKPAVQEVMSHAAVPLSSIYAFSATDLVETQLLFKNTVQHYEIRLLVRSMENLIAVDLDGTSDPYFVVYFADSEGLIVDLKDTPTADTAVRILHKAEKLIGGAAAKNKSDILYKSRVISNSLNPVWFEEVLIDSEKHCGPLKKAKYLRIEAWDKNDVRNHVSLGEVFIPLLSAKHVESNKAWQAVEQTYGLASYPIQLSAHMKKSKYPYAATPTLGSLSVQLLRKELPPKESGDHDLIRLNITMQLKPIGAMDFSWPARIITAGAGAAKGKGIEDDLFHIDPAYDTLRIFIRGDGYGVSQAGVSKNEPSASLWSSSAATDRMNMLQQCQEFNNKPQKAPNATSLEEEPYLKVPYNQIHRSDIHVINTEMLMISLLLNRLVSRNGQPELRAVAIDFLIGPCPAADLNNVLHQRIGMNAYREQIQRFYSEGADLLTLDAVAKGLQTDVYEAEKQVAKISEKQGESGVLANSILDETSFLAESDDLHAGSVDRRNHMRALHGGNGTATTAASTRATTATFTGQLDPEAEMAKHGSIFGDSSRRLSAIYWRMNMPARVLMTRKIFFQVYNWFLLDFCYSEKAEGIFASETVFNDDYVNLLVRQARARLKTGDETDFRAVDGDDSDDDAHHPTSSTTAADATAAAGGDEENEIAELDTNSVKVRIEEVMKDLDYHLRALQFYAYRNELSRQRCLELANTLVYKHYLLLVGYLNEIFAEDFASKVARIQSIEDEESEDAATAAAISAATAAKHPPTNRGKPRFFGYHIVKFIDDVNKSIQAATGPQQQQQKNENMDATRARKTLNPVKKRDLIAFIISKDKLFEEFLEANLFANGWKFSSVPSLAKCLNFDVLIKKFAVLLGNNILKWNSQALRVIMCRTAKPAAATAVAAAVGVAPGSVGVVVASKGTSSNSNASPSLPWDINTLDDHAQGVQLYISHIPETIQIQLNVHIELKKIPLRDVKENLSMSSIWRVLSINKQIANSISRAYVALAVEYEYHLINIIDGNGDDLYRRTKQGVATARHGEKIRNFFSTIAVTIRTAAAAGAAAGDRNSIGRGEATVRRNSKAASDSTDELLCFLMSIINDCSRIRKRHIPRSISKFTDDYNEVDEALQHPTTTAATAESTMQRADSGGDDYEFEERDQRPSLSIVGAVSDIERTFANSRKAIEAVEEKSLNYLSSQILFHSELREYFLKGFDSHLQVRTEEVKKSAAKFSSLPLAMHRHQSMAIDGAEASSVAAAAAAVEDAATVPTTEDSSDDMDTTSPVAVINATLAAFYGFAEVHLGCEEFNSVVYSCLRKFAMRYLIFVRDLQFRIRNGRSKGISHFFHHEDEVPAGTSLTVDGNDLDNKYFSKIQMIGIQEDLKSLLDSYEVRDERVAEMLRFLNTAVVDVLSGMISEPEEINDLLKVQFHIAPPPLPSDCMATISPAYERALEDYIAFNTSFSDVTEQEMRLGVFKTFTIQFSEFTVINLEDYRVIVVRVTFDGVKEQTTILPAYLVGVPTLRWKDIVTFTNVQGYGSKNAVIEVVEIRPLKLRRELVLARVNIELSELSRFLVPEAAEQLPTAAATAATRGDESSMDRNSIAAPITSINTQSRKSFAVTTRASHSNSNSKEPIGGHAGWYVMENVRLEPGNASPLRIVRTKLKRTIVAGITATAVVAKGGIALATPAPAATTAATTTATAGSAKSNSRAESFDDRTKNSFLSVLSSDRPRDNITDTQIRFRIRIFKEHD